MEKKSLENEYDILSSSEPVQNQYYLILQEDRTIINMNKAVQYVTQVQDIKTVGNGNKTCVFDTGSQQYYVNIGNGTQELIPINDEFSVQLESNDLRNNGYILQSKPISIIQETEPQSSQNVIMLHEQKVQTSNSTFSAIHQENDITEITLSDEQYQLLEQKGWILLESNDKIFVLNTLGLHDITSDEKLIQKLRAELEQPYMDIQESEIISSQNIVEKCVTEDQLIKRDAVADDLINDEESNEQFVITEALDVEMVDQDTPAESNVESVDVPIEFNNVKNVCDVTDKNKIKQNCDSIKIKTKYKFSDIPDKIFLGKTVNGKNLYAKVSTKNADNHKILQQKEKTFAEKKNPIVLNGSMDNMKPQYRTGLDTARFINLIQDSFRASSAVSAQSIDSANQYIISAMQLAKTNFKDSVVGDSVVITKIVATKTEDGVDIGQPTMITGTVEIRDGKSCFVHIPQMLQKILKKYDKKFKSDADPKSEESKIARDLVDLFHIHVYEMRIPDKTPQISISLCKRKLPLDVLNNAKKRHPNPIFACGACGQMFKSQFSLQDHQNTQCLEAEDELTIDTDELGDSNAEHSKSLYYVTEAGKDKWFHCAICKEKFTRLYNCQKHLETHKKVLEKKGNVYKCKMCPASFSYSSSLSKHIMRMHLQIPSK